MDINTIITKRRSIRKYKDKQVSDRMIDKILEAARLAPSGTNTQPWKFKVIKDDKTKQELKAVQAFPQDFIYQVPVIIVCCADPSLYVNQTRLDLSNEMRAIRDVTIASSYLMLQATELGLGTCYIGWLDIKKVGKVLNIPKGFVVPYVITLGFGSNHLFVYYRSQKRHDPRYSTVWISVIRFCCF